MATSNTYKTGNAIGATTKGASVGGGLAAALGTILGYVLVKTQFETDPETVAILSGAIITVLSSIGALIGGKLSPTSEGDALAAQSAVEQIRLLTERNAALTATGPVEYAPTVGEEPVTEPVAEEPDAPEDDVYTRLAGQ